jgi:Short C-terminal domain
MPTCPTCGLFNPPDAMRCDCGYQFVSQPLLNMPSYEGASTQSSRELMRPSGSALLSNTWKQELVITEDGVHGETIQGLKRLRMTLPYDRIAQVNLIRGVFRADLELVNKGGTGNLVIKALKKVEAEAAKVLIEQKMREEAPQVKTSQAQSVSIADELRKLADLKAQGVLTDAEFEAQKQRLLG